MQRKKIGGLRIVSLFCAVCLLVGVLTSCTDRTETEVGNKNSLPAIIVGSDNYPPYRYEDADGNPTGIDVDLASEAFSRMGYRVIFTVIDWEEKKELVENGRIDCIWGSFTINGREDLYNWTEPYMYSRQVVAVRKDSEIQSLADLAGKRVAVQSTTKPESMFLTHSDSRIPQVSEVLSLQNRELIYFYLSKGYADAIAAHETAILQCMDDYNLDYRILDEPLLTVGLGVAFAKDDKRGIAEELSKTFDEMRKDGTMKKILSKYLDDPDKFLEVGNFE